MGHAHAAADGDVPTRELAILHDSDEAEVVGEDVDVVVGRHGEHDLEFPRQVVRAVDRLLVLLGGTRLVHYLLAVEPDLVVGAGLRNKVIAHRHGELVGLHVNLRQVRVGDRHDAAIDVAAGCPGVDANGVDALHRPLHVRLDDVVELERGARRDAQGPVRIGAGHRVEAEPLLRGDEAARNAQPHHEAVGLLQLLLGALAAHVTVVLHVGTVKLQELGIILDDGAGDHVGEALRDRTAQEPALLFQHLIAGALVARHRVLNIRRADSGRPWPTLSAWRGRPHRRRERPRRARAPASHRHRAPCPSRRRTRRCGRRHRPT